MRIYGCFSTTCSSPLLSPQEGDYFYLDCLVFLYFDGNHISICDGDCPSSNSDFFQNFISWLIIIPWIFLHGIHSLKTQRAGLIFVRSIGGLFAFAFLFMAVQRTSLVDAILLNNAAPLIVPFAVWIWLKIPINHKLWPGTGRLQEKFIDN
jgi:hypothetical protein